MDALQEREAFSGELFRRGGKLAGPGAVQGGHPRVPRFPGEAMRDNEVMRLVAGTLFVYSLWAADVATVEQIVAKVNGDIVTKSEIERTKKQMEAQLTQRGVNPRELRQIMAEREKDALRDRIDELLLVQRAKELNISVDTEVSKYLAEIQQQQKIADPEKFQQWVRENSGMTYEDFRADIRNNMMTQRVIGQEVHSKINLPRAEIEKYYEEHKAEFLREEQIFLKEIMISTEGKDAAGVAAAEKKAKDVVARAKKGERFSDLVRDNSDSPTAKEGGNLGSFKKSDLREEIVTALWDKPKGFVTDPVTSPNGFVILRVEDHFKAGQASLEEVENEIKERLYTPLIQPRIREYLSGLRRNAFLEIRPGYVDTGAASGTTTAWNDPATLKPVTITKEEVALQRRMRKLLWVPIPGTTTDATGKSSSK